MPWKVILLNILLKLAIPLFFFNDKKFFVGKIVCARAESRMNNPFNLKIRKKYINFLCQLM